VVLFNLDERRYLGHASHVSIWASRMEVATRRRGYGAWNLSTDDLAYALRARVWHRDRGNQSSCIWVQGVADYGLCVRELDNSPQVHDGNSVADVTGQGQIVGYK
jgi:hypothetical protein